MSQRALVVQHEELGPPGLIGERAREHGFQLLPLLVSNTTSFPDPVGFDLIIIMGALESVYDTTIPWIRTEMAMIRRAVDTHVPILGICFGSQILAQALGGNVQKASHAEVGWQKITSQQPDLVPPGPWMVWHEDVFSVPPGGTELARSGAGPQAFVIGPHLGVQFHPEVTTDMVARWTRDAAHHLERLDVDPARLLADTKRHVAQAEHEVKRLFDAFYERVQQDGAQEGA